MDKLRLLLGTLGLCAASSVALAGIIFLPSGGKVFENVDTALVTVGNGPGGTVQVRTTRLEGRLTSAPGGTGPAGSFIAVTQQQELILDRDTNAVRGRVRGTLTLSATGEQLRYAGDATGTAECVARSGSRCTQLVLNLSVAVVVSAPTDASRVGLLRMEQLGSLVRDGDGARWATLDANVTLGGNEIFIERMLISMEEGEDIGV